MKWIVRENYTLPNGVKVQSSILPKEPLSFNQWAAELGVSSSWQPKVEEPASMRMMREYTLKNEKGVLGFM